MNHFFWRLALAIMLPLGAGGCFGGCSSPKGEAVAEHAGETLTAAELRLHIPPEASAADSTEQAKAFIQQWKAEVALMKAAEDSLPQLEERIFPRVKAYQRQLKIHALREHILHQRVDTTVSDEAITQYYNANIDQFQAKQPLYQYHYVITTNWDTPQLRKRLPSDDPEDEKLVRKWCQKHAQKFKLSAEYLEEKDLEALQQAYFPSYNLTDIRGGAPVVVSTKDNIDNPSIHFIYMLNRVEAGDPLPRSLAKPQIRQIILQKRREKVITQFENQVLHEAS